MLPIDVFFSRPGSEHEIQDRIKIDLRYAKTRIFIAQYNFTDEDILEEVIKSKALDKRIIVNYNNENKLKSTIEKLLKYKCKGEKFDLNYITSLGNCGTDKFDSLMHHKFMITDDVLWTGSYNFSKNASQNNWENAQRISELKLIELYCSEFLRMYTFSKAIHKNNKLSHDKCIECNTIVNDPFEHFSIEVELINKKFSRVPEAINSDVAPNLSSIQDFVYDVNGELYQQQKLDWLEESRLEKKSVLFNSRCRKDSLEGISSRCKVCEKELRKSNFNTIKMVDEYSEEIIEFDWGFYPDDHEYSGKNRWDEKFGPRRSKERRFITEKQFFCINCLYFAISEKIRWFRNDR